MKTTFLKTTLLASAFLLAFTTTSCKKDNVETDTEEVAEDQNEAKFDDNQQDDAEFLIEAAEINMDEIALGQLAQTKGTSASVKEFGKAMEAEHTSALNELKTLAASKNVTLPAGPTEDGQEKLRKFQEKDASNFDKDYASEMVSGHKDAIDKFEKAADRAADADIRAWANKMLPSLRTHLQHAEQVKETLK